ncbi:serine hydrolase domain-containing protein [Deinococcus frigens]
MPELVAFLQATSAPGLHLEESDLVPVPTAHPELGDWAAPLVYLNRGLKVETVHEHTERRLSITARERHPIVTGRVRLTIEVDPDVGQLKRFHLASVHDGHRFVTVPTRPEARVSVWSAAQSYIDTLATHDLFSGCVLLRRGPETIFQACAGIANQASQTRIGAGTRFNLASLTKMFTAVGVLRMVQDGRLSLQDEINDHLPQCVDSWRGITVHELLTHTGGFGPAVLTGDLHWLWKDRCRDMETWWDLVKRCTPEREMHRHWHYSNVGYVILGVILQHAAQKDYFDTVRELIFKPAGMHGAGFDEIDFDHPERATGYELHIRHPTDLARPRRTHVREIEVRGGPHGYAYANAMDLVNFIQATRNGTLLDEARMHLLASTFVPTNRSDSQAGYGVFKVHADDRDLLHMSGAGTGISAWLDFDLSSELTTVVLSNYGPPAAHRVGRELRSLLTRV